MRAFPQKNTSMKTISTKRNAITTQYLHLHKTSTHCLFLYIIHWIEGRVRWASNNCLASKIHFYPVLLVLFRRESINQTKKWWLSSAWSNTSISQILPVITYEYARRWCLNRIFQASINSIILWLVTLLIKMRYTYRVYVCMWFCRV